MPTPPTVTSRSINPLGTLVFTFAGVSTTILPERVETVDPGTVT
jgi:hypothetical protein